MEINSLLIVRRTACGIYNIAERQKHNKYMNTQFYVEPLNGENHGNRDSTIHKRVQKTVTIFSDTHKG